MSVETSEWLNSSDSKDYFELLKFPTVGAETAHLRDCVQCATWLKKWLKGIGAEVECLVPSAVVPSAPKADFALNVPVVYGELKGAEGAATVLFYGHYDVQPADPITEWATPPFEPTLKEDGRVYCRGANDDKGQTFAFLCGLRELLNLKTSKLPTLKILLDGQEESGSAGLIKLLEDVEFRKRLAADVMLVCDTSAAAELRPAIVAGLRGVAHFTVRLTGPNRDLHSGEYGGIAPNPAQGLAELLSSLHHPDGSIAVAGFRDGIEAPSHEELVAAEAGAPSELDYAEDIGCEPVGGQLGKSLVQRNSFEPTIEVNGIHSGHGGLGAKTIIPAEAVAKLSLRLVPGQSPREAMAAVRTHLEDRCPKGMKIAFEEVNPGTAGFRLPLASPLFRLATEVLTEMDSRGPIFQWDGASIPVLSALREASGAAPLIVGWGQAEDRIHSPNESYSIRQFQLAKEWAKRILAAW